MTYVGSVSTYCRGYIWMHLWRGYASRFSSVHIGLHRLNHDFISNASGSVSDVLSVTRACESRGSLMPWAGLMLRGSRYSPWCRKVTLYPSRPGQLSKERMGRRQGGGKGSKSRLTYLPQSSSSFSCHAPYEAEYPGAWYLMSRTVAGERQGIRSCLGL